MPRGKNVQESPAKLAQNAAMWGTFGKSAKISLASWDCKQVMVVQALLEVVASGATVVLRPGSGGGSLGVAIWEGDARHAPTWCYTSEELDEWAKAIIEMVEARRHIAAD